MSAVVDFGITRDGLVQLRRHWRATTSPFAAVLLVHGIGEHSGRYEAVGDLFAAAGVEVVAIDLRGFGESDGRRGDIGWFGQYLDDVEDQLAEVRALGLPIALLGHSMGGLIALSYVLDNRPPPELLVLSGPALGAAIPAPLRAVAPLLGRLVPWLRVRSPITGAMLASDPAVGEAYFADPLVVQSTAASVGAAMIGEMARVTTRLHELAVPTLVLHGGDDPLVPPKYSRPLAALAGVERRELPGLRHEVLQEPSYPQLVADIVAWMRGRLDERYS
jgi:alpha-beta hydrolase superfamily lysophospholipase